MEPFKSQGTACLVTGYESDDDDSNGGGKGKPDCQRAKRWLP